MAIKYTVTNFQEPGRINENAWRSLKDQLNRNPSIELDPSPETFSERFSRNLNIIKISVAYLVLFLIVFGQESDYEIFNIIAVLAIFMIVISIMALLMEGPSYATYIKHKKEYFERMKYALQNSNSYNEFCALFYNR